jgi:hypothetical protein
MPYIPADPQDIIGLAQNATAACWRHGDTETNETRVAAGT